MNLVQLIFTVVFIGIGIIISWRILCAVLETQGRYFLGFKIYFQYLWAYQKTPRTFRRKSFLNPFKSNRQMLAELDETELLTKRLREMLEIQKGLSKGLTFQWVRPTAFVKPVNVRLGYVYVIQDIEITGFYKIGRSIKPEVRLSTFEVKLPFKIKKVCTIPSDDCVKLEKELHKTFKNKRRNGEWFELSDEDVQSILDLT